MTYQLFQLLNEAVSMEASDLHLTIGKPPVFRIHGELISIHDKKLLPDDTDMMLKEVLPEAMQKKLEQNRDVDFSYGIPGVSRFRLNAYYQRSHLSMAIRVIQSEIPTLDDLCLPKILKKIAEYKQGLILVTGPTGSGKSTTLAAMIQHINQTFKRHVITLEDPIEYLHRHDQSIIDQREIGSDTKSFASGLRAALRQDPDVILVGELRDSETISTAITAAETGHLVLGTLHTSSAAATVDRIIDVFDSNQQKQLQLQLASVLAGVISQRLIMMPARMGRKAATEILINNYAIANLIRTGKIHQIENILQTSSNEGMRTLEMSIQELIKQNQLDVDEAQSFLRERQ